ncbi:N-(5'-phosphoribosyl)anthranilate isomerase [Cesiribacter andamanensis AMV16]|uniref:N-(5'-phosphoribosyl)anthranilate isomerase n=2 Tax=Cesiribacter TaxID=1133570 RepID=M7MWG3_9BACT|nr:N-(5'-phosphoribosyl)anthranilate isomerase [Cesiribacter andamanensis AMV16]
MKQPANLQAVSALKPQYLGFIFWEKSPRYMPESLAPEALAQLPDTIKKVGVFVNAGREEILQRARQYQLQAVQLHGEEGPALCRQLRQEGLEVIRAIRIGEVFQEQELHPYLGAVDYFLFDTLGQQYGGTGKAFNWQLLTHYSLPTPFFLSGGLELASLDGLETLAHLPLHALDVNSKFEVAPGLKNIPALQELFSHPMLLP